MVSPAELQEDREKLIAYIKHFTLSVRPEIPTTSVDYYKFVKLIGKGAFGIVFSGHYTLSTPVAVKRIQKAEIKILSKVQQEVEIMIKAEAHINILRYIATETNDDFL